MFENGELCIFAVVLAVLLAKLFARLVALELLFF